MHINTYTLYETAFYHDSLKKNERFKVTKLFENGCTGKNAMPAKIKIVDALKSSAMFHIATVSVLFQIIIIKI
ncbi:hypothetical protein JZ751_020486 [Albula glossodonta]|uniref:Uncharacterized protein n=1 Tax=Albula glossodonta TaxID=121402 RepID=A0A8T2PFF9_9TELE|nr:hypothetical protein JZ751_020486 [Albula glossodonta]